jgi:D-ribose pyranose/furanose isomerase RbsD
VKTRIDSYLLTNVLQILQPFKVLEQEKKAEKAALAAEKKKNKK